ncbi:MAG: hypothetical protein ACTSUO_08080 [Candidatus Thorarchaeota archaeon]
MGDSRFDSDDVSYSTVTNMDSLTEEEFRAGNRSQVLASIVLLLSPVLVILMFPAEPSSQSDTLVILIFGAAFVCAILGSILLYYYGIFPRMVLKGYKIL